MEQLKEERKINVLGFSWHIDKKEYIVKVAVFSVRATVVGLNHTAKKLISRRHL